LANSCSIVTGLTPNNRSCFAAAVPEQLFDERSF